MVKKKNPSSFWFKTWLHPRSPFPHPAPFSVAAVTYNRVIVKQCIAQSGSISRVCALTSAPLPPGMVRLPIPATALPSALLFLPNRSSKDVSCVRTAALINAARTAPERAGLFRGGPELSCPRSRLPTPAASVHLLQHRPFGGAP